jgi:hypothetical protein
MAKKEKRHDNLFSFRRDAQASPKDTVDRAELDEALATVVRAIEGLRAGTERLAAKVDALIGKGGLDGR